MGNVFYIKIKHTFTGLKNKKTKKHSRAQYQHIIIHKWKYSWVKPQHKNKHWEKSDKVIFLLMPSKLFDEDTVHQNSISPI